MYDYNLTRLFVAGTILFVVFALFLIYLIVYIRAKQNTFYMEKQKLLFDTQHGRIEEGERVLNEVSKRVHDDIIQTACLLKMSLMSLGAKETEKLDELEYAKDIVRRIIDEGNRICFSLNTDFIRSNSLYQIIEKTLEYTCGPKGISYHVASKGTPAPLNPELKVVIFRIAMEAFQNIAKHSAADEVGVELDYSQPFFLLRITDNGNGFASEKLHAKQTTGIANMYQRAKMVNGELTIESGAGEGCTITLAVSDL
jgi:signal transduction histidine kinase